MTSSKSYDAISTEGREAARRDFISGERTTNPYKVPARFEEHRAWFRGYMAELMSSPFSHKESAHAPQ